MFIKVSSSATEQITGRLKLSSNLNAILELEYIKRKTLNNALKK